MADEIRSEAMGESYLVQDKNMPSCNFAIQLEVLLEN
jgi:hypothetical protein